MIKMNSLIKYVKKNYTPRNSDLTYILHSGGRGEYGFITLLFYSNGQPIINARISRGNEEILIKEYKNLQKIRNLLASSELKQTIEEPLAVSHIDGHFVLFKKHMKGISGSKYIKASLFRKGRFSKLLRTSTTWLVDFLNNTRNYHIRSSRQKLGSIKNYDMTPYLEYWIRKETFFLAPSHGDLTLSNILIDKKEERISGVIDFECFTMKGNPIADFMGIITNTGNTLFGENQNMINRTFFNDNSFSREVGKCVELFSEAFKIEIEDLIRVLPTYSDREICRSKKWSMNNLGFHMLLKKNLVERKDKIFFWLR